MTPPTSNNSHNEPTTDAETPQHTSNRLSTTNHQPPSHDHNCRCCPVVRPPPTFHWSPTSWPALCSVISPTWAPTPTVATTTTRIKIHRAIAIAIDCGRNRNVVIVLAAADSCRPSCPYLFMSLKSTSSTTNIEMCWSGGGVRWYRGREVSNYNNQLIFIMFSRQLIIYYSLIVRSFSTSIHSSHFLSLFADE